MRRILSKQEDCRSKATNRQLRCSLPVHDDKFRDYNRSEHTLLLKDILVTSRVIYVWYV